MNTSTKRLLWLTALGTAFIFAGSLLGVAYDLTD
jgi:hypothetical protein